MRVLLTGASGFLGAHLAEALLRAGHTVRASLRATSRADALEGLPLERVRLELSDPSGAEAACADTEVVVHAAGITRAKDPADFFRVNTEGTLRLAEAARRQGVRRFVFVSSLEARGPDGGSGPDSPYGESKLAAERGLREVAGLEPVLLRPAGVYGPRDRDLLALFRLAGWGVLPHALSAHPLQPVYALDVAAAVLAALERPCGPEPLELAERRAYRWDELRSGMQRAVGRPVRLLPLPDALYLGAGRLLEAASRFGDAPPLLDARRARALSVHAYTCDPTPALERLGWQAEVPLAEGLIRTAEWYRLHGWL